ncbi:MAG: cytochrome c oxidase subunit 4 [Acidimicrobiales bacterium]
MKAEWRLFVGGAVIVGATSALYWFITYEDAGSVLLALMFAALLLVGGWLALQARRLDRPRPEDGDGSPAADDQLVGYFPSSSIWPFVGACGVVVLSVGLVFGVWLSLFGGILLGLATVGFAAEANAKR